MAHIKGNYTKTSLDPLCQPRKYQATFKEYHKENAFLLYGHTVTETFVFVKLTLKYCTIKCSN